MVWGKIFDCYEASLVYVTDAPATAVIHPHFELQKSKSDGTARARLSINREPHHDREQHVGQCQIERVIQCSAACGRMR